LGYKYEENRITNGSISYKYGSSGFRWKQVLTLR